MLEIFIALAKKVGGPGSIGFFNACLLVGLLIGWIGPRTRRVSRVWILLLVVAYLVLSLPIVANGIADSLTSYRPLSDLSGLKGVKTLVVLDGDNRRGRVREAKRLFDGLGPDRVIVSGGDWLFDAVRASGIPPERITAESGARTTLEQIEMLDEALRSGPLVVVASRLQMPRIARFAQEMQLPLLLAPSAIDTEPPTSGLRQVIPRYIALRVSRDALYEHAALIYYRHRCC